MSTRERHTVFDFGEAMQRAVVVVLLVVSVVVLPGCGGEAEAKLEDYLLELEFETPLESTCEVELGSYVISVAARQQDVTQRQKKLQWMQVRFRLSAVVNPKDESAVKSEIARHRGLLDDTILQVCRSASIEELADSRWAILKARIIDRVRPILGPDRLRQLLIVDNICEAI